MKNGIVRLAMAGFAVAMLNTAWAGNDPAIKGDIRSNVQFSMNQFIQNHLVDGKLSLFDPVKGELLKLKLDELHSGIVKKGDFYVSCADFTDQKGRRIDVDFLVQPKDNLLITSQALIHSVDGKKRKYHLEKI